MPASSTATEKRILSAAKKIFYEKGLSGARTQEIANKAGINKAMLHYYFRSKERLYDAVLANSTDRFIPTITDILNDDKLSLNQKIEQLIDSYLNLLRKEPKVAYFVVNAFNQNPEKINGVLEQRGNLDHFFNQVHEEINKGEVYFMPPEQLLVNIIALTTYPFIARPFIEKLLAMKGKDFDQFMQHRKKELLRFILNAIKPSSKK